MLQFKDVWNLYHTYYHPHRLYPGETIPQKTPKITDSLLSIQDEYDILLLDGFGVLNVGAMAVPHMPETIATLQALGKEAFVLTNGASHPSYIRAEGYPKLGYDLAASHIISSRDAVEATITEHEVTKNGGTWGVISVLNAKIETIPANCVYLTDDNIDTVDGFLFLGAMTWDLDQQLKLHDAMAKKLRPLMIGNPDISAPMENSFSVEPGFYAIDLLKAFPDLSITYCGKPFKNAYEVSLQKMAKTLGKTIDPSRVLMVGDTLHTDILGGNMAGMKTALKADWGFLRDHDPRPRIEESLITPDFIISQTLEA